MTKQNKKKNTYINNGEVNTRNRFKSQSGKFF